VNAFSFETAPERQRTRAHSHRQRTTRSIRSQTDDGFLCKHCNSYILSASFLSGVQNRNHCPICLWSRHMDWREAGDRLSACKSPMKPIGLTVKATWKKYGSGHGELMLIHLCTECENLSINRIAADDDPQNIFTIFEESFRLEVLTQARLDVCNINILDVMDRDTVLVRLFGHASDPAGMVFHSRVSETV
jgi:RNHCP domain